MNELLLITSAGADVGSSAVLFEQCETCYEANPFLYGTRDAKQLLLIKTPVTAFQIHIVNKIEKSHGKKEAKKWTWIFSGLNFALAGWNLYLANKHKDDP